MLFECSAFFWLFLSCVVRSRSVVRVCTSSCMLVQRSHNSPHSVVRRPCRGDTTHNERTGRSATTHIHTHTLTHTHTPHHRHVDGHHHRRIVLRLTCACRGGCIAIYHRAASLADHRPQDLLRMS